MDKKVLEALSKARVETRQSYSEAERKFVSGALKEGYNAAEISKAGKTLGMFAGRPDAGVRNFVARVKQEEAV